MTTLAHLKVSKAWWTLWLRHFWNSWFHFLKIIKAWLLMIWILCILLNLLIVRPISALNLFFFYLCIRNAWKFILILGTNRKYYVLIDLQSPSLLMLCSLSLWTSSTYVCIWAYLRSSRVIWCSSIWCILFIFTRYHNLIRIRSWVSNLIWYRNLETTPRLH